MRLRGRPRHDVAAAPRALGWPDRLVGRLRRDVPLVLLDALVVVAAYALPLVVRIEGSIPERFWLGLRVFLPFAILIHLCANYVFGLYGQMWRYAGVKEARRVVMAGVLSAGLLLIGRLIFGPYPLPRSVLVAGVVLVLIGCGAIRFQIPYSARTPMLGVTATWRLGLLIVSLTF